MRNKQNNYSQMFEKMFLAQQPTSLCILSNNSISSILTEVEEEEKNETVEDEVAEEEVEEEGKPSWKCLLLWKWELSASNKPSCVPFFSIAPSILLLCSTKLTVDRH